MYECIKAKSEGKIQFIPKSMHGVLLLVVPPRPPRIVVTTCDYDGVVPSVWGEPLLYSRS